MRKTVPMQPADVAAWTEIARIAAEKLEKTYEGPRNPYIDNPELLHARMGVVMKKPDVNDWVQWAFTEPYPTHEMQKALLLHECMHAAYGHLSSFDIPDECRVVSLMQNEGE